VKFQYDESSAHGVLQQQHDHFCITRLLSWTFLTLLPIT
jgi:hypothetical protein